MRMIDVHKRRVSGSKKKYNTFLGASGGILTNRTLLAAKFVGISTTDIRNFEIDENNNIRCLIQKDFEIINNGFHHTTGIPITYFIHKGEYLKNVQNVAFYWTATPPANGGLRLFLSESDTILTGNSNFRRDNNSLQIFSSPKCTQIGDTAGNDSVFSNTRNNLWVYVDPVLETINSGSPDGDLQYVLGGTGSSVKYATNLTKPNEVGDITVDEVYSDSAIISWDAPASTNDIDWYLIFANGNYVGRSATTEFIYLGLTPETTYNIEIITLDEMGNFSDFSEAVELTTTEAPELVLDDISSAIHAWSYSRKLRSGYSGTALRLVSSAGGNPTANIGFRFDDKLNEGEITSFIGGNNGTVDILRDQIGSRDFLQTNASFRPTLVNSGTIVKVAGVPYADFDGTNDYMTTNDSETPILDKDCTVFVVFESQASVNSGVFFEEIRSNLDPSTHRIALVSNLNATGFTGANYAPTGTNNTIVFASQQPTSTRRIYVFKKTGTLIELFDENGFIDDTTSALVFSVDTLLEIGRQLVGDIYFGGKFAEGIICNDSLDSTDYNKIMDNLKAFFL